VCIKRGSAALRRGALWLEAPLARTRPEAATQVIRRLIPAYRLSGVGRNRPIVAVLAAIGGVDDAGSVIQLTRCDRLYGLNIYIPTAGQA